jgi:hypothetical protein
MLISKSDLSVSGSFEQGVVMLTLKYNEDLHVKNEFPSVLRDEMCKVYEQQAGANGASCIVTIAATRAGSSVVRAVFELYKKVRAAGGKMACVQFPVRSMFSLTALGLPRLDYFILAPTREKALELLNERAE